MFGLRLSGKTGYVSENGWRGSNGQWMLLASNTPQCVNQLSSPNLKTVPLIQAAAGCSRKLSKWPTWRAWTSIAAVTPDDPRRTALPCRAFVAKATWGMKTTRELLDRLKFDLSLRRMCGWVFRGEVPSEATVSRAFADFAVNDQISLWHCFALLRP